LTDCIESIVCKSSSKPSKLLEVLLKKSATRFLTSGFFISSKI
jgi:hypothetical protein